MAGPLDSAHAIAKLPVASADSTAGSGIRGGGPGVRALITLSTIGSRLSSPADADRRAATIA